MIFVVRILVYLKSQNYYKNVGFVCFVLIKVVGYRAASYYT